MKEGVLMWKVGMRTFYITEVENHSKKSETFFGFLRSLLIFSTDLFYYIILFINTALKVWKDFSRPKKVSRILKLIILSTVIIRFWQNGTYCEKLHPLGATKTTDSCPGTMSGGWATRSQEQLQSKAGQNEIFLCVMSLLASFLSPFFQLATTSETRADPFPIIGCISQTPKGGWNIAFLKSHSLSSPLSTLLCFTLPSRDF